MADSTLLQHSHTNPTPEPTQDMRIESKPKDKKDRKAANYRSSKTVIEKRRKSLKQAVTGDNESTKKLLDIPQIKIEVDKKLKEKSNEEAIIS